MAATPAYHHGHLKEALVQAALALIREGGPRAFTLREAARRAGVSHNAPYRHFRDKEALLAAVATEGFLGLDSAMRKAAAREAGARARLKSSGLAYIDFALRRPEHFTVMFDLRLEKDKFPACAAAARQAFQTLVGFIEECQKAGVAPAGSSRAWALAAWSLVHGIGKLAVAGQLPQQTRAQVLEFASFAIDAKFGGGAKAG